MNDKSYHNFVHILVFSVHIFMDTRNMWRMIFQVTETGGQGQGLLCWSQDMLTRNLRKSLFLS